MAPVDPITRYDTNVANEVSTQILVGDVDADGMLSPADLDAFDALAAQQPVACGLAADTNQDGAIDAADRASLVAAVDAAQLPKQPGSWGEQVIVSGSRAEPGCSHTAVDYIATRHSAVPGQSIPLLSHDTGRLNLETASVSIKEGPGAIVRVDASRLELSIPAGQAEDAVTVVWIDTGDTTWSWSVYTYASASAAAGDEGGSVEEPQDIEPGDEDTGRSETGGTDDTGRGDDTGYTSGNETETHGSDGGSSGTSASDDGSTDTTGGGDCPQRGRGYCLLQLILVTEWSSDGFEDLPENMRAICNGQANVFDANVLPAAPTRRVTGYQMISWGTYPVYEPASAYNARRSAWLAGNNAAIRAGINAAKTGYRACLRRGAETGLENYQAHGAAWGGSCGIWATSAPYSVTVRRCEDMIQGNYDAANKNVCSWVLFDASCKSGLSVDSFQHANGTGTATCPPGQSRCPPRAGYENDTAVSSSTSTTNCSNWTAWWDNAQFEDALEDAAAKKDCSIGKYVSLGSFAKSYQDAGYNACGN